MTSMKAGSERGQRGSRTPSRACTQEWKDVHRVEDLSLDDVARIPLNWIGTH